MHIVMKGTPQNLRRGRLLESKLVMQTCVPRTHLLSLEKTVWEFDVDYRASSNSRGFYPGFCSWLQRAQLIGPVDRMCEGVAISGMGRRGLGEINRVVGLVSQVFWDRAWRFCEKRKDGDAWGNEKKWYGVSVLLWFEIVHCMKEWLLCTF